jgi:hypothetical protein
MTLEDQCFHAVINVRIAHEKQDISEFALVMRYCTPDLPAFDIILDKIAKAEAEIMRLENLLNDL